MTIYFAEGQVDTSSIPSSVLDTAEENTPANGVHTVVVAVLVCANAQHTNGCTPSPEQLEAVERSKGIQVPAQVLREVALLYNLRTPSLHEEIRIALKRHGLRIDSRQDRYNLYSKALRNMVNGKIVPHEMDQNPVDEDIVLAEIERLVLKEAGKKGFSVAYDICRVLELHLPGFQFRLKLAQDGHFLGRALMSSLPFFDIITSFFSIFRAQQVLCGCFHRDREPLPTSVTLSSTIQRKTRWVEGEMRVPPPASRSVGAQILRQAETTSVGEFHQNSLISSSPSRRFRRSCPSRLLFSQQCKMLLRKAYPFAFASSKTKQWSWRPGLCTASSRCARNLPHVRPSSSCLQTTATASLKSSNCGAPRQSRFLTAGICSSALSTNTGPTRSP